MTQKDSVKILVFGIIGLACGVTGYGSIVGLVFSILAIVNYKKFNAAGLVDKKATVGKKLGIAGLIIGIIALVLVIVLTIVFAVVAANSNVTITPTN